MTPDTDYQRIFERAKACCAMLLEAQEDLKQLKTDAKEELITDGTAPSEAKAIKADLSEVFALAMIEAKGEIERQKQAAKLERRQRMAEIVGVQLDLVGIPPASPVKRMARAGSSAIRKFAQSIAAGEVEISTGGTRVHANGKGGVTISEDPPHDLETGEITSAPTARMQIRAEDDAAQGRPTNDPRRDQPSNQPGARSPSTNADLDEGLAWAKEHLSARETRMGVG